MQNSDGNIKPTFTWFTKDSYSSELYSPELHIFLEDISSGVLPILGTSESYPEFEGKILGEDSAVKLTIALLNSLTDYDEHYNTSKLICNTVNDISRHLFYEGIARYEIINTTPNVNHYALYYFPSKYVYHFFNYYIHYIPKNKKNDESKGLSVLKNRNVFEIKIPQKLGGVKAFKKIKKTLDKTNLISPSFFANDPNFTTNPYSFDFGKYTYNIEVLFYKITSKYGWYHRDTSDKYKTEFYLFYRILNYKLAQAIIREHIIEKLNLLLQRIDLNTKIEINGIPSSNDLVQMKNDFIEGKIKLESLSDKLWF